MADLINVAARLATLEGLIYPIGADGTVLTADSTNQHGAEWAAASGMPSGVYMDEYGNIVFGAANIAAFPTDRAGELSGIYVGYDTVFTPPPAGVEVHGLWLYGESTTLDLSGMQSGQVIGCTFSGCGTAILANDSGEGALIVRRCVVLTGTFRIESSGTFDNIRVEAGDFEVSSGLPGNNRTVDTLRLIGNQEFFIYDDGTPLSVVDSECQSDSICWLHSGAASGQTTVGGLLLVPNGILKLGQDGTGSAIVSGVIERVERTDSGDGDWTIYGVEGLCTKGTGAASVVHRGLSVYKTSANDFDRQLEVSGFGIVEMNEMHARLGIRALMGPTVYVQDGSAGTASATFRTMREVRGMGEVQIIGTVNLFSMDECHVDGVVVIDTTNGPATNASVKVEFGSFFTTSPSGAGAGGNDCLTTCVRAGGQLSMSGDGCQVAASTIESAGSLNVTGNSSVIASTVANFGDISTDGFDMNEVVVLSPGSYTLTADNTGTYRGFGLDTLV